MQARAKLKRYEKSLAGGNATIITILSKLRIEVNRLAEG